MSEAGPLDTEGPEGDVARSLLAVARGYVAMAERQLDMAGIQIDEWVDDWFTDLGGDPDGESADALRGRLKKVFDVPSSFLGLGHRRTWDFEAIAPTEFPARIDGFVKALQGFDQAFPAARLAAERLLTEVDPSALYELQRIISSFGAARINCGRALLSINEYCVKILGLKDQSPEFPSLPTDAASVGSSARTEAGRTDDVHADEIRSAELSLEVPVGELLNLPEVKQIRILQELGRATSALATIEQRRADLVREARELGISWARIGQSVETTPQAAYRRWDEEARQKSRDSRGRGTSTED